MKTTLLFLAFLLYFKAILYSQVTLYTESFETDGEGSRYFSNTYNDCATISNPDYFLRTNTNPVLPPSNCVAGFGNALTLNGLQGTWFWAGEDIRSNAMPAPGARPPGNITTQVINVSGYNTLTVSMYLATASNNGARWEMDDSINIHASLNGGTFFPVGRFVGGAVAGGDLRQDLNLDGLPDGAVVSTSVFTKYTFSIPGTGTTLRVEFDFDQFGGTEESAIDLIEVKGNVVVPVELLRFEAYKAGDAVNLNWETATEKENNYFSVERSDETFQFQEIGKVDGSPNNIGHTYSWTDGVPKPGVNYYRLRQYDKDGTAHVSPMVQVRMGNPGIILKISPNPAAARTSLELESASEGPVQIALFDVRGNLQWQQNYVPGKGVNQIELATEHLEAGIYFMRVESEGRISYARLVKTQE